MRIKEEPYQKNIKTRYALEDELIALFDNYGLKTSSMDYGERALVEDVSDDCYGELQLTEAGKDLQRPRTDL